MVGKLQILALKKMSKDSVPEADGIKHGKIEMTPPASEGALLLGARPNFKRKRSFWRAARRGEVWALMSMATYNLMSNLEADLYGIKIPKQNFLIDKYIPNDIMYFIRKSNE